MSNLDAFRVQVDELKQRLCPSDNQGLIAAEDIKTLSASIKATVQRKQDEIDRLTAENEQLRRMLDEALSAANEHHAKSAGNELRDFYAEMGAFINPGEPANAADGPDGPDGREPPAKAEPDSEAKPDSGAKPNSEAGQKQPIDLQQSQPGATDEQDEVLAAIEDSPALKRIMQRGRRGR